VFHFNLMREKSRVDPRPEKIAKEKRNKTKAKQ